MPPASAVPDLNAIPEDAPLPSEPLPPPAASAVPAPSAQVVGVLQDQPAPAVLQKSLEQGQGAPEEPGKQQPYPPLANGYLPKPGAPAAESTFRTTGTLAEAPVVGSLAVGVHGTADSSAVTAANHSVQHASAPETAAAAISAPAMADPSQAPAAGVSVAAQPDLPDQPAPDKPSLAAPAISVQEAGPPAEVGAAGTTAAAEASAMLTADRAVAIEEAMEVRHEPRLARRRFSGPSRRASLLSSSCTGV